MYMLLNLVCRFICTLIVIAIIIPSAIAQTTSNPIDIYKEPNPRALPVAIYEKIPKEEFRKLIIVTLAENNFTFISTTEELEKEVTHNFLYSFYSGEKFIKINVAIGTNENLDVKMKCVNCFLKLPKITNIQTIKSLPWLVQYDLMNSLFSDMDKMYASIKINGLRYMDKKFGFDYEKKWNGERNFSAFGNSLVDVNLLDLKQEVIKSYVNAGFLFIRDKNINENTLTLIFNYPINVENKEGVVYGISFLNQLNDNKFCHPCEITETYDPHQKLPAVGILGVADRLTLESRFIAARARAFELLKNATSRYLRPRTTFVVPPKPAPLGSPRHIPPPIVT